MNSVYCPNCHVMLMKAKMFIGEIKCHKCKQLVNLHFVTQSGYDTVLTRGEKSITLNAELLKRAEDPRGASE